MIKFGTGGWRAVIGDDFTKQNIQILAKALANKMKNEGVTEKGIVMGYDRRFLAKEAMQWAAMAATRYILGIRPQFDYLEIDPCIPAEWDGFEVTREWRGARFNISIENPDKVMKGVVEIYLDDKKVEKISVQEKGSCHKVKVVMG